MRARRSTGWGRYRRRAAAWLAFVTVALVALLATAPRAQADDASLTLDVLSLTFPSADPDTVPEIGALQNPVSVSVTVRGASTTITNLTVLAAGDLASGADIIPISRVRWTALGQGFVSGTLSHLDPQLVGQWFGKKTDANGSLSFRLQNSWSYATGFYSQVAVYTLISY